VIYVAVATVLIGIVPFARLNVPDSVQRIVSALALDPHVA
jgi:hypothetical protein